MKKRILRIVVVSSLLLSFIGISAPVTTEGQTQEGSDNNIDISSLKLPAKGNPGLDSQLNRLVEAGTPEETARIAARNDMDITDNKVRVIIECEEDLLENVSAEAEGLGVEVEGDYGNLLQTLVPVSVLAELAEVNGVKFVRLPMMPLESVVSEGVSLINADKWQTAGYTGSGVKIAVLDKGFTGYNGLLGADLPMTVTAQSFYSGSNIYGYTGHGTACAEIIYDIAPEAQMYLVNFGTEVEFGNAVNWLITQDVDIISFSVGWPTGGPGDGTGPICSIVDTAKAAGILWSQSVGNSAQQHWQGNFCNTDGDPFHEFIAGADETNPIYAYAGDPIVVALKWSDAWGASGNDFDLLLLDDELNVVDGSGDVQNGDDIPVEGFSCIAPYTGYYFIVIMTVEYPATVNFHLYSYNHDLEYQVASGSLAVPADSANVMSVGAVAWNSPSTLEPFSSQGPTKDGRIKPDLVAPDGVSTVTYGDNAFYGTSASAPCAAGAAALVKDKYPAYTPAQIQTFLEDRAVDLGVNGKDYLYGSGRLDLLDIAIDTTIYSINCSVNDAVLSEDGKHIYLSSSNDKKLYILNLSDGTYDSLEFIYTPERMAMSPNGNFVYLTLLTRPHDRVWFSDHQGYIAEIDTRTRSVVRTFWINEDPYDITVTSDNFLYVTPGSGQWDYIRSYNLSTTNEVGSCSQIRALSRIALHPDESKVYALSSDISPYICNEYNISAGIIQYYSYISYLFYNGQSYIEISPDGEKIMVGSGRIFSTKSRTEIGNLGISWVSLSFDTKGNIYSIDNNEYSTISRKWKYDCHTLLSTTYFSGKGKFNFYKDGKVNVISEFAGSPYVTRITIIYIPLMVTSTNPCGIYSTSAVLNGELDGKGSNDSANVSFIWGTTSGNLDRETIPQIKNTTGNFNTEINGLISNTTYYYRAKAVSGGETVYGDELSFKTLKEPPAIATLAANNILHDSANFNGNLDSLGEYDSTNVSFEWGVTSGNLEHETIPQVMTSSGNFTANISGLSPGETYYYRAKAAGNGFIVYGNELSFNTTAAAVTTLSATKLGATAVTINGNLDSLGTTATANVSFVWGISSGNLIFETAAETKSTPGSFSFELISLSGNTTFYYKAKAVGCGTVFGIEKSFTTLTSGCFIATAAFGSYLDPHLDILRSFRDKYLITNELGQDFVDFYYTNSPPVANFITEHSWLKPLVRAALMPVVLMSTVALKITLAGELAIIGFLVIAVVAFIIWMRKRHSQKTSPDILSLYI